MTDLLRHCVHHLTLRAGLVAGSTIMVMTDEGMDQMDPPSPKLVAALLRDARSV